MLESVDIQLLYMIDEAEKTKQPISTWFLASRTAKTSAERNKLDGLYRYHLEELARKGVLKRRAYTKGKQRLTSYVLNPKRCICLDGALFILSTPITIIACPHLETCKSNCNINFAKYKGNFKISGCTLLENAPDALKQQVYRCLQKPEPTVPMPAPT